MEAGHRDAWHYSLGMIEDEARRVVQRHDNVMAAQADLMQRALSTVPYASATVRWAKAQSKHFQQLIKAMRDGNQ